ncbi:CDI toxin immunity protein [Bacillus sp. JJ1764]|uniref:CDI toxin immunity protein n=1 Tax=Bacillus sp. JJ1764 TaxID=3122964 RepID=UPI0030009117
MRSDRKKKLQHLLERQKTKVKVEYGALFEECIEALGKGIKIYSLDKSKDLYQQFQNKVPFTSYTRIDWSKFQNYNPVQDLEEIVDKIDEYVVQIYWSYGNFPVLETKLERILKAYDDVTVVSADTYLYVPNRFVIEIYHEGEITFGYL